MSMDKSLKDRLVEFARRLAAEQWHYSYNYGGDDTHYQIEQAVEQARAEIKAEIGRALLDALEDKENE